MTGPPSTDSDAGARPGGWDMAILALYWGLKEQPPTQGSNRTRARRRCGLAR